MLGHASTEACPDRGSSHNGESKACILKAHLMAPLDLV